MRFSRSATPERLRQYLASRLDSPLSYPEVGTSLGALPVGYRHDSSDVWLGESDAAFRRATQGLTEWQAHRAAGVRVYPPDATLATGTTVALALPLFGVHALAACRIVAVIREASRFGFAYGTVAGHPERGEEAFVVERIGDTVRFRITVLLEARRSTRPARFPGGSPRTTSRHARVPRRSPGLRRRQPQVVGVTLRARG